MLIEYSMHAATSNLPRLMHFLTNSGFLIQLDIVAFVLPSIPAISACVLAIFTVDHPFYFAQYLA
jgi:hypothetical protein